MNQLFQFSEIKRYYKWSLWSKTLLIYSLMASLMSVTLTTCALLLLEKATLNDSSAIFLAIIGGVAPVLAVIYGGRSYERSKGVKDDDDFATATAIASEGDKQTPIDPFSASLSDNPLDLLRSLDLSEYEPKIADDHAQIR